MEESRQKNWRRCVPEILGVRQGVAGARHWGIFPGWSCGAGGSAVCGNCTMLGRVERKVLSAVGEDGLLWMLGGQGVDCNDHLWF